MPTTAFASPSRSRLGRSSSLWLLFAASLLLIRYAVPAAMIEQTYSRGAFRAIRTALDATFGWWPVPASAVLLVVLPLWYGAAMLAAVARERGRRAKLLAVGLVTVRAWAGVFAAFMLLWGFNYGRVPVDEQLGLDPVTLTTPDLWAELEDAASAVAILRAQLPLRDAADAASRPLSQGGQTQVRRAVHRQLARLGYPPDGLVRVREVVPGGLLHFNTSGVYFPLTGEGHVDAGLHGLQVPFVTAHEMLHGFGITDEGACNFFAYLACTNADNLYLRYSGHLTYYRYVAAAVLRRDPGGYAAFRQNLPAGVRADLDSINYNLDRFAEIAPALRDAVYDSYLRSQGVADGLASYSRIIDLVVAYRQAERTRARPQARPVAD